MITQVVTREEVLRDVNLESPPDRMRLISRPGFLVSQVKKSAIIPKNGNGEDIAAEPWRKIDAIDRV